MPRPTTPVGSYGDISYRSLAHRKVRALAWVRDADGVLRQVTKLGTSNASAKQNLLDAIDARPGFTGSDITSESHLRDVANAWLAGIDRHVEDGHLAPNTARIYHGVVERHIIPGVGGLRLREASTARLDAFIVGMRTHNKRGISKTSRTVLNGILGYAVRQGALAVNPMREVDRIRGGREKAQPRALSSVEREQWLAAMEADEVAVHRDIPDLTMFLMATGARIGEALAVTFVDVDVSAKTVSIDHTIVRVKGRGLLRTRTKSAAGERTLLLPSWATDMLIRRGDERGWRGPVFPVPGWRKGKQRDHGAWRDPSNTSRDFRDARERAGFDWVTTHNFRKTVATIMDEAGMTAREIADQLGHAKISMTQDNYLGRRVASTGAAVALEDVLR